MPKTNVAETLREEGLRLCRQRLDAFSGPRGDASATCKALAADAMRAGAMLFAKARGPH